MNHNSFLLDTSALIAFLENEPGAERVEDILLNEKVFIPWPVLFEVYYIIYREKGQAEAENLLPSLKNLPATILWEVHEAYVLSAARIKARHQLSVADAMIAAYSQQQNATLVHKDPEYRPLSGIILQENLPLK